MLKLCKNKKGLSTVVTTLIILVSSVVLGASVTLYGVNIFQARSVEEAITVSNVHLWANSTGTIGAFVVKNTGGKDTGVQTIQIRGSTVPLDDIYYWMGTANQELQPDKDLMTDITNSTVVISVDGTDQTFTKASGSVGLSPGQSAVIYLNAPSSFTSADAGLTATMGVFGSQAASVNQVTVRSTT